MPASSKNIVIYSDGTGQVGGINFDEVRTNIYKLYRATRCGPDTTIDPKDQLTFYDPGLGSSVDGGRLIGGVARSIYNTLSQASGLGITRNIIDCYAAIIRMYRPGDKIFLFGFSRGAYTIRCVASVLSLCGVPTSEIDGKPLKRDLRSTTALASKAVKGVYQFVGSPRDKKYVPIRDQIAAKFRSDYQSHVPAASDAVSSVPFFIGVYETVAALAHWGLAIVYSLTALIGATVISWLLSLWIGTLRLACRSCPSRNRDCRPWADLPQK